MLFAVFEYKGLWLDNIEGDWKIPTSIPSDGISDGTEHWVIIPRTSRNFALSLWRDWRDLREWKPRTLHADVPTLTAHRSLRKTQKLVLLFFCQKSKSAVICRICVISVPSKFFTKPYFRINPAGKAKVPSWKIFISQLENYFFPVGKSKFRSRAI